MPIYEYRCTACSRTFEKLILGGRAKEDLQCPACGGKDLTKLISAPFLPSSVGKPANDDAPGPCCGSSPEKENCSPGSCCSGGCN